MTELKTEDLHAPHFPPGGRCSALEAYVKAYVVYAEAYIAIVKKQTEEAANEQG